MEQSATFPAEKIEQSKSSVQKHTSCMANSSALVLCALYVFALHVLRFVGIFFSFFVSENA